MLPFLAPRTATQPSPTVCNVVPSFHTWHNRLGHPSSKHSVVLKDALHIVFFPKHDSKDPCLVCPLAKQNRLRFESHNHLVDACFDLVNYDVWGPYASSTHANCKYFLTLVDYYSRYTWTFLMKRKSNALVIVPRFFRLVET